MSSLSGPDQCLVAQADRRWPCRRKKSQKYFTPLFGVCVLHQHQSIMTWSFYHESILSARDIEAKEIVLHKKILTRVNSLAGGNLADNSWSACFLFNGECMERSDDKLQPCTRESNRECTKGTSLRIFNMFCLSSHSFIYSVAVFSLWFRLVPSKHWRAEMCYERDRQKDCIQPVSLSTELFLLGAVPWLFLQQRFWRMHSDSRARFRAIWEGC